MQSGLKRNTHVNIITIKANSFLGFATETYQKPKGFTPPTTLPWFALLWSMCLLLLFWGGTWGLFSAELCAMYAT